MKKDYNVGIAILRTIMCFMVVLCHCWDAIDAQGIMKMLSWTRGFAVPVFMMMSFVLVQNTLVMHNKEKMSKRFERLLIPQFGWAAIYWFIYYLIDVFFNKGLENGVTDMFWQMFTGHSPRLNATMWYQVDLIFLTVVFLMVILVFKHCYELVLSILLILSLLIQYSGIYMVFASWRYELKYPIGRFFEMIPIAVVGFMISAKGILEKIKTNRTMIAILSGSIIFIDMKYSIFSPIDGYGYEGVEKIVIATAFIALFLALPFEMISDKMNSIINFITRYTMGVYCMHRLIFTILTEINTYFGIGISVNSFGFCIIIYVLCFACAWIGDGVFGKTKLKALFN